MHTLVSQLGDRTGTPLALDEDGILTLMFENDVEVTMEYDDELSVLQLYAVIGEDPLDDDIRLTLYGTLLEANMAAGHLRRHPGAGRRGGELLLTREIDLAVADLDHLANATEAMAETAAQWRDILDAPLQGRRGSVQRIRRPGLSGSGGSGEDEPSAVPEMRVARDASAGNPRPLGHSGNAYTTAAHRKTATAALVRCAAPGWACLSENMVQTRD